MSPEQARREYADHRSDIYGLGATLHHVLTLRVPIWDDDADRFWTKKREGSVDPITPAERRLVPGPLLNIALKAMAPDPARRYQAADDLVHDLEAYQAGLAVSAHQDSLTETIARWHRRHGRTLWASTAALVVIVVLGLLLYGEKIKEIASWGSPIVEERFQQTDWQDNWSVLVGGWDLRADGWLVSNGATASTLTYRHRIDGDVAIEYEAMMLPGAPPCDLSLVWNRDLDFSPWNDPSSRPGCIVIQFGAHGGMYSRIIAGDKMVAFSPVKPESGVIHRVRVEIVGSRVAMQVDGRTLCEYVDPFPLPGGYPSLYGYLQGKAFRNIRIFSRILPQKVPATVIGDHEAQRGRYAEAAVEYEKIARAHQGAPIAEEARYKQGLCEHRLGNLDRAFAVWKDLPAGSHSEPVELARIDRLFSDGDHDQAASSLESLCATNRRDLRSVCAAHWCEYAQALISAYEHHGDDRQLLRYLDLRERRLASEHLTDHMVARALNSLGRFDETLSRFPGQPNECFEALSWSGRIHETAERRHGVTLVLDALLQMGRFEEAEALYPKEFADHNWRDLMHGEINAILARNPTHLDALLAAGRLEEILAQKSNKRFTRTAMVHLGRFKELDAEERDSCAALMAQRRYDRAFEQWGMDVPVYMWPRHALGLERFIRGDHAGADDLFAVPERVRYRQADFILSHYAIVPFLRHLAGDVRAFERARAEVESRDRWTYGQQPWFISRYLSGSIDEAAYLAQPIRLYAPANLLLLRAILHDRDGRAADAMTDYRSFLALPSHRREWNVDPVPQRFCEWRLEQLGRKSP